MWVASYGVIPQTYMRAVASGAVATTDFDEVSKTRTAGPLPGRSGKSGLRHESTA